MINGIVKLAIAAGAAAAAWYTDKYVKEKTGKHIHEHAIDFVKSLWNRLRRWANKYLDEHPKVKEVYISAVSVAAAIKRAKNAGQEWFELKVFGKEPRAKQSRVIKEETVTLDEADAVLETAKTEAILAQR